MRLAQIAPDAPVLGNILAAEGANSVALFVNVAIILGKDIRTAMTCDTSAANVPAARWNARK